MSSQRVLRVGLASAVGLAIGLALGLPESVLAGSVTTPPRTPEPIIGGVPVEEDELDAVVAFSNSQNKRCSGTLVAPRLVLTAGHCLSNHRADQPLTLFFGPDTAGLTMQSERFGVHPQFCELCTVEAYDFGYIELPEDYAPVGGFLRPLTDQAEWDETMGEDKVLLLAGYGTDDPTSGGVLATEIKRKVSVTIDRFSEHGIEFFAGGDLRDTCHGDSGGPAIVQLGSGPRRLAGVTSRGSDPCGRGGWYGVPFAALLWVQAETGVELLPLGCEGGGCLDTTPAGSEEEGCCFVGGREHPAGWLLVPLLVMVVRRRRVVAK